MSERQSPMLEYASRPPNGPGLCLDCYSSLAGVEGHRCPECGRPFDPASRSTMHLGPRPGRAGRFYLTPFGWPMHTAAMIASITLLCGASAPGGYFLIVTVGLLLWLAVGASWTIRVFAAICACARFGRPFFSWLRYWPRILIAPTLAVLTIFLLAAHVPVRVAFWISRPSMDRFAAEVMAAPSPPPRRWVGVFPIDSVERIPQGMQFRIRAGPTFVEAGGFAWCGNGTPIDNRSGSPRHTHLGGNWYTWATD